MTSATQDKNHQLIFHVGLMHNLKRLFPKKFIELEKKLMSHIMYLLQLISGEKNLRFLSKI
jgi:hypothetical protein